MPTNSIPMLAASYWITAMHILWTYNFGDHHLSGQKNKLIPDKVKRISSEKRRSYLIWCDICDPYGFTGDISLRQFSHRFVLQEKYHFTYSIEIYK